MSRELFEQWCTDRRNGVIIAGYCVEGTLAKVKENWFKLNFIKKYGLQKDNYSDCPRQVVICTKKPISVILDAGASVACEQVPKRVGSPRPRFLFTPYTTWEPVRKYGTRLFVQKTPQKRLLHRLVNLFNLACLWDKHILLTWLVCGTSTFLFTKQIQNQMKIDLLLMRKKIRVLTLCEYSKQHYFLDLALLVSDNQILCESLNSLLLARKC